MPCQTLGNFVHAISSLSCMNEYLIIDSGGYLCMKSSHNGINCSVTEYFPDKSTWCSVGQINQRVKHKAF